MQRIVRSEDGSITVMVAVLLPLLLVMFGVASGTLVVAGGERELQRAASAAATAAATQMDVVSIDGLASLLALSGGGGSVGSEACAIAAQNLTGSPMLAGFGRGPGSCNGTTIDGTASVSVSTEVDGLGSAVQEVDDLLDGLVGADGLIPLGVLGSLSGVVPGVDQLSVTALLGQLLPSVVTPRVRVTATSIVDTPLGELLTAGDEGASIEATAVARRRLKNVVVLPTAEMVCTVTANLPGGLLGVLPPLTVPVVGAPADVVAGSQGTNDALLTASLTPVVSALPIIGTLTGDLLGGVSGIVASLVDPLTSALSTQLAGDPEALTGDCSLDLNRPLDEAAEALFDAIDQIIASPLLGVLDGLLNPLGVSATCILNGIVVELRDLIDPIGEDEAAPTLEQVIAAAQYSGEPVLVYTAGVTTALGIPLLDVVPVAAGDLDSLLAGDLGAIADAAELGGLYRTSLIEESPFDEAPLQPGC